MRPRQAGSDASSGAREGPEVWQDDGEPLALGEPGHLDPWAGVEGGWLDDELARKDGAASQPLEWPETGARPQSLAPWQPGSSVAPVAMPPAELSSLEMPYDWSRADRRASPLFYQVLLAGTAIAAATAFFLRTTPPKLAHAELREVAASAAAAAVRPAQDRSLRIGVTQVRPAGRATIRSSAPITRAATPVPVLFVPTADPTTAWPSQEEPARAAAR